MNVDVDFNDSIPDKTEIFLQMTKIKSSNKRPKSSPSRKIYIILQRII